MNVGIVIPRRKQATYGLWMLGVLLVFLTAACSEGFTGPTETRETAFLLARLPGP